LALAAGLPPVVFDIGAPAERLRAAKTGRVLDLRLAEQPTALNDALLALPLEEMWRNQPGEPPITYGRIVETYYGNATA
jgi:O-antigen biosynthesis protein